MLSEKPWRAGAVVRLVCGIFISMNAASLLMIALHHPAAKGKGVPPLFILVGAALLCLAAALLLTFKRWTLENFTRRAISLMACVLAGLCLGVWAQKIAGPPPPNASVGQMLVATLSFQGPALVLVGFLLREQGSSWAQAFGFLNDWKIAVLLGIIVACFFLPVGWALQQLSVVLLEHLPQVKPEEQQAVQTIRAAASWRDHLALGAVTILLAPFGEEMLFRGVVYPWIKQAGFPRLALWLSALMFAASHVN